MIFKSRLCGGHSISSKNAWSSFLFKYLFNLCAVCLGSLSCWKVKRGPINRLPDCMAWWMKICLYFSTFIIPSILTKSQLHQLKYNPKLVSILHHVLLLDVNRVLVTVSHFFFVCTSVACFQKSRTLTCHSTAPSIGQNSRYFSSLFVSFFSRPLLGLSSTCPVSWCFFNSAGFHIWILQFDAKFQRATFLARVISPLCAWSP